MSEPKERPILFSSEMVRAILAGRKTMTRRVIKTEWWRCLDPEDDEDRAAAVKQCPYGKPGDRLWVREAFRSFSQRHIKDHDATYPLHQHYAHYPDCITIYRSDGSELPEGHKQHGIGWAPSIHMHRYESRIMLEVVSVRVERLQDITTGDVVAEGVMTPEEVAQGAAKYGDKAKGTYTNRPWADLWDSINAKRGHSWQSNPWVWVVEFKRL